MFSSLKTSILLFSLAVANVCYAQPKQSSTTNNTKPNILFIMVDDLGYGDIGVFYQNLRQLAKDKALPFHLTPELDQMAHDGGIFTHQYSNAPVCAPSRASFITGMTQGNAHIRNNQFDKALENNHTIATVLKNAGYATAAIGKWGLQGVEEQGPHWPAHPLKRGFDYYYGYMRHADGHEHYPYEGIYRGKKEVWENYNEVSSDLQKCYTTDLWTAAAKRWILENHQQNQGNKPFMMFLAYDTPHAVLELPTQAYPQGKGLHGGVQWLGQKGKMINTASGNIDSYIHPDYAHATYDDDHNPNTLEKPWPDTYTRYATSVRRIDDAVGDLIALLKDLKIEDNTLIVFTSDNGPSIESYLPKGHVSNEANFFGSYGPFDGIKRDVWEGGLRMPVIAYWPNKLKKGTVIEQPSMLSDWLATFADAASLPIPARTDGISLLPLLENKKDNPARTLYVEYAEGGRTPKYNEFEATRRNRKRGEMQMLRQGDIVGVRYDIKSALDSFEIYNVVKDPKQIHNLAKEDQMADWQKVFHDLSLQLRRQDKEAPRVYDNALIPSVTLNPKKVKKGLKHEFFKGDFPYVANKLTKTHKSSTSTALNLHHHGKGIHNFEGYIDVPTDGWYTFTLEQYSPLILYIHGALAFDADFDYQPGQPLTYKAHLAAGLHPIRITTLNNGTPSDPVLKWAPENKKVENLTPYFFHIK